MKYRMIAAIVATMLAGAVQAQTYICIVKPDGHDTGWISKTIAISIDAKTNEVLVNDEVILYFNKKPVQGHLSTTTEKRLTVTWEVRKAKDDNNTNIARFMYRATIYKLTNKIIVSARPGGYDNSFGGSGKCQIRK